MKVGKIKYLNCLPYYADWISKETIQFEEGSPAQINQMMRAGAIDAAPISSMEYLQRPQDYLLFPDLGIASREYVRSVTLFSKKKIEDLANSPIAVTEESLTSTHLLQILLKGKYGFSSQLDPMPSDPKAMFEKHDAILLIGNDALLAQPRKWIHRYDLGQLWWEWQKLPFVYAVWAVRRKFSEESMRDFYHALKERFLYNKAHLSECIQKHCSVGEFDRIYPKIFGYLTGLQYEMDESCWQGFKKFAELAEEQGFCGKPSWERVVFGSVSSTQPPLANPVKL